MTELNELIIKCIKKDTRAEYALYKKCFNTLMRICWRYTKNEDDAAAVLNKGFLKILNNLDKYESERSFDSWIKTIMINSIIDEFRINQKSKTVFVNHDIGDISQYLHPIDLNVAEQKLSIEEIVEEIKKLPEQEMRIFNLYVFDGLSHKEIGTALNIPSGTSRSYLSSARTILKKRLSKILISLKTLVLC